MNRTVPVILGAMAVLGASFVLADQPGRTATAVDRVGEKAQQLWTEALLMTWPLPKDDAQHVLILERFRDAIKAAEYKPPILVSLGSYDEDVWDNVSTVRGLLNDAVGVLAAPDERGRAQRTVELQLQQGIARLQEHATTLSLQCFVEAVTIDPGYLPGWQRLAQSGNGPLRDLAIVEWRIRDPDNACPWYLEALTAMENRDWDRALVLVERGNRCPILRSYEVELPEQFDLTFPDNEVLREIEANAGPGLIGRPVTAVGLRNMIRLSNELSSYFHFQFGREAREFVYWALDRIALAREEGDAWTERRLRDAMRGLARRLISQDPPVAIDLMLGLGTAGSLLFNELPSHSAASREEAWQRHELMIARKQLATAFVEWTRDERIKDVRRCLTGDVDLQGEEIDLCRRLLRESRYLEIFDETFGTTSATE